MNKEVEELLKQIEEKEKIIRKYELLLDRFKISDRQENAKPNEEFESLKKLGEYELKQGCLVEDLTVYDIVKQELNESQEQKNVLEIIKNIIKFGDDLSAIINFDTYEEYSEWSWDYDLTQKEFELLKRYCDRKENE